MLPVYVASRSTSPTLGGPHVQPHLPRHRDRRHLADGIDAAVRNGIARAARTLRHLDWFEVTQVRGQVKDGGVEHFQVGMKVGFRLEDE